MIPTKKSIGLSSNNAVKVAVPRILESEVKTTHLLGEGAYGQVWKGTCRSNPVAVKYIHPEKYNPESFLAELTILFQVFSLLTNSTVGDCHFQHCSSTRRLLIFIRPTTDTLSNFKEC